MLRFALIAVMAIFSGMTLGQSAKADNLLEPVLIKGTTEYRFRTKLNECAAEEGVNFNHHFTVCTIGQGTDFQIIFIIDRSTGQVKLAMSSVDGKDKPVTSELGVMVTAESDIMTINPKLPTPEVGEELPGWLSRKFFYFDVTSGKFVHLKEKDSRDPSQNPNN